MVSLLTDHARDKSQHKTALREQSGLVPLKPERSFIPIHFVVISLFSKNMIDKLVKFFSEVAFVELHVDDALWTGNCCYNLAKKNLKGNKSTKTTK